MNRWINKVAVVTGANSGIGAVITKDLVEAGMKVVGLDLKKEKMEDNYKKMDKSKGGQLYARKCDITKDQEVLDTFAWLKKNLGGVDVLVNNAGIFRYTKLTSPDNSEDLRSLLEVNVLGLCFCTREAFNSMKERDVAGHIIHINSLAGHYVPFTDKNICLNLYPGTKHCVTALTEVLRQEMLQLNSRTKITSVSPSFVATELILANMEPEAREALIRAPHLKPEDVSQGVLFCLGTPEHVQVHELTIRSVGEKL